jgi:Double-GTPase 2
MGDLEPAHEQDTGTDAPAFEPADTATLLPGPDALDSQEAGRLLARRSGRVVVWAGERASGKTTLTSELYERQRRPGESLLFAGSDSLLALERLAHPSRANSGRRVRETRRTERDPEGRELIHIALAQPGSVPVNLLFADLPGEVFHQLRDNEISPADLPLLVRADKVALLADGVRLADPDRRANVASGIRQLLRAIHTNGTLDERTELALVVTMWDCVVGDQEAESYWAAREQQLTSELRNIDPQAPVLKVAARAPADWGHSDGMRALADWVMKPVRVTTDPPLSHDVPPGGLRSPKRLVAR